MSASWGGGPPVSRQRLQCSRLLPVQLSRLEKKLSGRIHHHRQMNHLGEEVPTPSPQPSEKEINVVPGTEGKEEQPFEPLTEEAQEKSAAAVKDVTKDKPFAHTCAWSDIRDTLYEALPEGVVEFGCKGVGYGLQDGSTGSPLVNVCYVQQQEQRQISARLLVGADGFYSKIRAQWMQDGPPSFAGIMTWRARLVVREGDPDPAGVRQYPDSSLVYKCQSKFDDKRDVHFLIYPAGKDIWVWVTSCPTWRLQEVGYEFDPIKPQGSLHHPGKTGGDLKQCCLDMLEGFCEPVLEIVRGTPAELVFETGFYERDVSTWPEDKFGDGPLSLVGDAAHLSIPGAQGLHQSLEDAAVLGWHLQQLGLTEEALRAYEKERLPRVKAVFTHLMDSDPEKARLIQDFHAKPLGKNVELAM